MAAGNFRSRSYCFTVNNYTEDDIASVAEMASSATYVVYGKEVGEQGTPHLQGYCHFSTLKTFRQVSTLLPRAHLIVAKGSADQNFAYCTKSGDFTEFGAKPSPGRRNDLEEVYRVVKETSSMKSVVSLEPNFQGMKCAEMYLKYNEQPRNWKTEVRWYHGPTGAGKTRHAFAWLGEDAYVALETNKYWEGYDGHENVIIDDFRKDFAKFHVMLRLLDRYQFRIEVKGGSRQFRARRLAITSCFHPRLVYETREDVGQLLRRIDNIYRVVDNSLFEDISVA